MVSSRKVYSLVKPKIELRGILTYLGGLVRLPVFKVAGGNSLLGYKINAPVIIRVVFCLFEALNYNQTKTSPALVLVNSVIIQENRKN